MCGRDCSAGLVSHLSMLLAVWSGLALAWCGVVLRAEDEVAEARRDLPAAAGAALLLPFVAAPLTLVLAHTALAGSRAPVSRAALLTYATCAFLSLAAYVCVCGWACGALAGWARSEAARAPLRLQAGLRAWLAPLLAVLDVEGVPAEGLRGDVAAVWAAAALWPLLQLVCAGAALCAARRPPREPRSTMRRSSSVYYEPSAPPPLHKAPLDQHSPWM